MDPGSILSALSEPTRRSILDALTSTSEGLTVGSLARSLGAAPPAVSQHLKVLVSVGLLTSRRAGRHNIYRFGPEGQRRLHQVLSGLPSATPAPVSLSARNRLLGTVVEINSDVVTSSVTIDVGGQRVQAVITTEALRELGLAVGDAAYAVIKATEVMVMR